MRSFADVFRLPAPARQPCDVVAMLERVVRSERPARGRPQSTWRWDLDAPGIRVIADPAQIEQALLNVVKNAVEAIGAQPARSGSTARRGGAAALAIEDSGPGLTPEAQANLFTPFFTTKPHGQGIGLTLVGEILADHGFDYALERTDRGTTVFRIVIKPGVYGAKRPGGGLLDPVVNDRR